MVKRIAITGGEFALVDDEDFDFLAKRKWHMNELGGYAQGNVNGKQRLMHTLVVDTPVGLMIDHINGKKLDNRRINLRLCTNHQNIANSKLRKDNTSGFKGVSWDKVNKKYQVRIKVHGRKLCLGRFANPEDAARVYDRAAIEHFGEFANLNFS